MHVSDRARRVRLGLEQLEPRAMLSGKGLWFDDLAGAPILQIRLQAVDSAGALLGQVRVGEQFFLQALVKDLRQEGDAKGVFSAYIDVFFNPLLASLPEGKLSAESFAGKYINGKHGDAVPGAIQEAGAFAGESLLNADERLLWSVPLIATNAGLANFVVDLADSVGTDPLIYMSDTPVSGSRVKLVDEAIQILTADGEIPAQNDFPVPIPDGEGPAAHRDPTPPPPADPPVEPPIDVAPPADPPVPAPPIAQDPIGQPADPPLAEPVESPIDSAPPAEPVVSTPPVTAEPVENPLDPGLPPEPPVGETIERFPSPVDPGFAIQVHDALATDLALHGAELDLAAASLAPAAFVVRPNSSFVAATTDVVPAASEPVQLAAHRGGQFDEPQVGLLPASGVRMPTPSHAPVVDAAVDLDTPEPAVGQRTARPSLARRLR